MKYLRDSPWRIRASLSYKILDAVCKLLYQFFACILCSFFRSIKPTRNFCRPMRLQAFYMKNTKKRKGEQTDFKSRNQFEITRNHLKSLEINWNHPKSPEITWNHCYWMYIAPKISGDFLWFQMISGDFRWFLVISNDFWWFRGFPVISSDFRDFKRFQAISSDFKWF
jgi:hypothetical protein